MCSDVNVYFNLPFLLCELTLTLFRLTQHCDQIHQAVEEFKEQYSEKNTVSIEKLLHNDYMSSEYSYSGETELDAHKDPQESRKLEDHNGRCATKLCVRGVSDKNYDGPPPKSRPLFASYVNNDWAQCTSMIGHFKVLADFEDYMIFKLNIPDNDLLSHFHHAGHSDSAEAGSGQSGDEANEKNA
ncbi:uncharacterized protein PHACADRAFT_186193 [Phanerochaete carnosa HHB-10118-sp]|uniref:Uncharacterized protein n=1 Tax=Phanerochaete carnosa (strain HHB-10118-sp) TaxID=650164 RepID=K5UU68_PHACS|nr:uncharacterized protein PHACADRAFT_186193 [Phanerochaete carnosa HHB-10118-sp]EKM53541.1 hypothetical protein PHACADRAFT_186193 [Phanerochaete carnosa HHB-10118-sp]